jgi:hypothetical protein
MTEGGFELMGSGPGTWMPRARLRVVGFCCPRPREEHGSSLQAHLGWACAGVILQLTDLPLVEPSDSAFIQAKFV